MKFSFSRHCYLAKPGGNMLWLWCIIFWFLQVQVNLCFRLTWSRNYSIFRADQTPILHNFVWYEDHCKKKMNISTQILTRILNRKISKSILADLGCSSKINKIDIPSSTDELHALEYEGLLSNRVKPCQIFVKLYYQEIQLEQLLRAVESSPPRLFSSLPRSPSEALYEWVLALKGTFL